MWIQEWVEWPRMHQQSCQAQLPPSYPARKKEEEATICRSTLTVNVPHR